MKRRLLFVLSATALAVIMAAGGAYAQSAIDAVPPVSIPAPDKSATATAGDVVEGYARPDYRDLIQTIVVLGGLDITNAKVANEYARLIECPSYRKYHADGAVGLVDRAVGLDSCIVLGNARSVAETGGAIVAGAGVDLGEAFAHGPTLPVGHSVKPAPRNSERPGLA